jgi:hypothetical protein
MSELIRGVIRCGRGEGGFEYKGHYRAGLFFDRHGREFIVDDRQLSKVQTDLERDCAEIEKRIGEIRKRLADAGARVDMTPEIEELSQRHAASLKRISLIKGGNAAIDEADKPLVLQSKLYEYLREANGKQLMFEPWNGEPRPAAPVDTAPMRPDERFARLEEGQRKLEGMFQQILDRLKK